MRQQLRADSDTPLGSCDFLAAESTLNGNHTFYIKPAPRLLLGNECAVAAATQVLHNVSFAIDTVFTVLVICSPVEGPRVSQRLENREGPRYAN